MTQVTIIYNHRCSKSRQTLALLEENDCDIQVVEYLKSPLISSEIEGLLVKLNLRAREIMRTNETEYKEQGLGELNLTEEQLIRAIVKTPKLLERPIVLANDKAALGRPPENVLSIL